MSKKVPHFQWWDAFQPTKLTPYRASLMTIDLVFSVIIVLNYKFMITKIPSDKYYASILFEDG